ncbi:MAG TPA: TldD/PmbA family protein, partial [Prolixibacteraceae bacterium]|nr:TldD/PmbA family protein [Prolixibacteraceae bacterium]
MSLGVKGGIALAAAPALLEYLASCTQVPVQGLDVDKSMLDKVIAHALKKGGDYAEVYIENRISRQLIMEESKFRSGLYGISQGAGVRVISGKKTGYAYTEEISPEKLLRAAEVASYVAQTGTTTIPVPVSPANPDRFNTVKISLQQTEDQKRTEIIQRANQAALDYDPRIKMAMIDYYDEVRSRIIANSEGVYLKDEQPLLFFIVQAMSDNGNARHLSRERLSMHSGFEMFDLVTPEEVAKRAAREAIAMLDAEDAPAGMMDVVMQNGWGGVLVHEAVGHPLEADNIAKKVGAFTGKLGQKVAHEKFTMVDD